ncbi:MAG TPA: M28 family peptidase [Candidatus Thermoplasmatota archaeon]|nr:M28 family peptidase [Candidatus Thermoplasmatota archaeon]
MRTGVVLAVVLASAILLAGCKDSPGQDPVTPTPSTTGQTSAPYHVDGQAVYDWVAGVVTKPDGSPHARVPGTADHAQAARWLAQQMEVPGWTVAWQNFTGQDYMGLDKGGVSVYADNAAFCRAADRARLPGLQFSNLVATRSGASGADPDENATGRTLILGAHWESKRNASEESDPALRSRPVLGANDGASGVGVLLQLMHELAGKDLGYGVQVVLFDGEDGFEDCHPLAGSLWFVHRLQEQDSVAGASPEGQGPHRRMLLLDMVGDPDARFIRESHSVRCDPALVDLLHARAASHGLGDNFPGTRTGVQDDHLPFIEAGIPAVDLIDYGRGFPPYWHTTHDTMENLTPGMLGNVASLVLDVIGEPGFGDAWPSSC